MLYANQIQFTTSNAGKKMPAGIHTNCNFTGTVVGDRYIDFNYSDNEQRIHNKRVWFPQLERLLIQDGETAQEALQREELEAFAHIVKH